MIDTCGGYKKLAIKARTKSALGLGERVGYILFGYRLAEDGLHIEEDNLKQDILSQMRKLRKNGLSIGDIAENMDQRGAFNRGQAKWDHASVHRIMKMTA